MEQVGYPDALREFKAGIDKNKRPVKELKEAEEKYAHLVKKVEVLTLEKAKAESELVRMTKVCDLLQTT
jgi:exonuclease VII small subunit